MPIIDGILTFMKINYECDIYEHDKYLSMLINVKMSTIIGILVFICIYLKSESINRNNISYV